MAYRLRFGDFDFPVTLRPQGETSKVNRAAQPRRRRSGSITQIGRRDETHLLVRGELTASTPDALNTIISSIFAASYAGKQKLWYGRDDRYYRDVQMETPSISWGGEGTAHGAWAAVSLLFIAGDYPEAFAAAVTTVALTSAGGTVAATGEAPALPYWSILMATAGTGALTLTNAATGETALLDPGASGWAAGDVITLDLDTYKVQKNGVDAFGLLQYRIPSLVPGNNAVALSVVPGGTAATASLTVYYRPQYR